MEANRRLSYWYVAPPLLTFVLILPPIPGLPPFHRADNWFQVLIVLPFYFGLVAAPGYLYAWRDVNAIQHLGRGKRFWIEISLIIAIAASFAGTLLSILTVIVAPFALWSFIMALKLFMRLRRNH